MAGTALTLWRLPARLDAAGARLLSRGKRSTLGATFVWQAQHKLQSYISSHTPHLIHPPSCISSYISSHKPAFQNYSFKCGVIRGFNLFTTLGQANGQTLPLASSQPKKSEILEVLLQAVLEEVRGLPAAIVLNEQADSPAATDILSRLKARFAQGIADGSVEVRMAQP